MPSSDLPAHNHSGRPSKHHYNHGCPHPACKVVANKGRALLRARLYAGRVLRGGRLIHPDLAPFDSDTGPRHGTYYGYDTYGCKCDHCVAVRVIPELIFPDPKWHVVSFLASCEYLVTAAALATLIVAWRTQTIRYGLQFQIAPPVRTATAEMLQIVTAAPAITVALLSVAVWALLRPSPGKHAVKLCPSRSRHRVVARQWVMAP